MRWAGVLILMLALTAAPRVLAELPGDAVGEMLPASVPAEEAAEESSDPLREENERRKADMLKRITIIRKYTNQTTDAEKVVPAAAKEELPPPRRKVMNVEEEVISVSGEEPAERYWFSASYLLWWIKAANVPPLLTTGPTTDPRPGSLDSIFTMIRFGDEIDAQERHGARFVAGLWLDDQNRTAFELTGFFLANRSISFLQSSPGAPVLARPFFDVVNNQESASITTYPGVALGGVAISGGTAMHGVETNGLYVIRDDGLLGFDLIGGFRYLDLEEDLQIQERSQILADAKDTMGGPLPFAGSTIRVTDAFDTSNDFFGGQIGLRGRYHLRRLEVRVAGKVAFGDAYQVVRIAGSTSIDSAPPVNANAGFLALPSNSGQFSRHTFAVVPEASAQFSFQLFKRFRIFAGYSYLFWSNVLRPGDQIDLAININQLPTNLAPMPGGPNRPRFGFRESDFWVQGGHFGVEFRW